MYLMYYMSEEGSRVYTLAKTDPEGNPTFSAHPARYVKALAFAPVNALALALALPLLRFTPEDKYSRQRITIKKRFNLLPTQGPAQTY